MALMPLCDATAGETSVLVLAASGSHLTLGSRQHRPASSSTLASCRRANSMSSGT
eukprot:CAMPEP_0115871562 /NCGR_PEP_ID=MMETSP0287-20121206/22941_1 /TAXON_ID=412157 /ORGANISM="Chrysochromulina rotalis, Strain UIO044" /LENGTH=54 /DNA_ID=CAMNT_0003326389 /DNA_START=205 /DNA_END=366 /DNA_ORIENTATION=-